ncbi:hypothetical protein HK098_004274 [Nowakowskiella sp. JEL0407]|nr:hypothetical protein HK098_004274 [Nowakowskiella sp. JEL0407]
MDDAIRSAVADFMKADELLPILSSFDAWLKACHAAAANENLSYVHPNPVASSSQADTPLISSLAQEFGCPWTTYPLLKKYTFNLNHSLRPLFTTLDKKLSAEDYISIVQDRAKSANSNRRNVLVCGAGPAGLRFAIECCLLRCDRVVVLEKRTKLTRYNVLHIWKFGLADLKALGAKVFFRGLGLGSLDVISIRRVQIVLLKIALILGVKVFPEVEYLRSFPSNPPSNPSSLYPGTCNWTAEFAKLPQNSPLPHYRYNTLVDATGPTVLGSSIPGRANIAKEFSFTHLIHGQNLSHGPHSGPTSIGITANFVLDKSSAAERAFGEKEGGRVSYLNKVFFTQLKDVHNIDIENIAFYRSDESHYVVFTPRKGNLLSRGVLNSDCGADLVKPFNVNREKLLMYCRDVANACGIPETCQFVQIPSSTSTDVEPQQLREDVSIFDFSTKSAATRPSILSIANNASQPSPLLVGLVGDSLLAPFWPLGTGLAHATLSSLDLAWTLRELGDPGTWIQKSNGGWCATEKTEQVLEMHKSAYTLLTTATAESVLKPEEHATKNPIGAPFGGIKKLGFSTKKSSGLGSLDENSSSEFKTDEELHEEFQKERSKFKNIEKDVSRSSSLFKLKIQVDDYMEEEGGGKKSGGGFMGLIGTIVIPLNPKTRYLKGLVAKHGKEDTGVIYYNSSGSESDQKLNPTESTASKVLKLDSAVDVNHNKAEKDDNSGPEKLRNDRLEKSKSRDAIYSRENVSNHEPEHLVPPELKLSKSKSSLKSASCEPAPNFDSDAIMPPELKLSKSKSSLKSVSREAPPNVDSDDLTPPELKLSKSRSSLKSVKVQTTLPNSDSTKKSSKKTPAPPEDSIIPYMLPSKENIQSETLNEPIFGVVLRNSKSRASLKSSTTPPPTSNPPFPDKSNILKSSTPPPGINPVYSDKSSASKSSTPPTSNPTYSEKSTTNVSVTPPPSQTPEKSILKSNMPPPSMYSDRNKGAGPVAANIVNSEAKPENSLEEIKKATEKASSTNYTSREQASKLPKAKKSFDVSRTTNLPTSLIPSRNHSLSQTKETVQPTEPKTPESSTTSYFGMVASMFGTMTTSSPTKTEPNPPPEIGNYESNTARNPAPNVKSSRSTSGLKEQLSERRSMDTSRSRSLSNHPSSEKPRRKQAVSPPRDIVIPPHTQKYVSSSEAAPKPELSRKSSSYSVRSRKSVDEKYGGAEVQSKIPVLKSSSQSLAESIFGFFK